MNAQLASLTNLFPMIDTFGELSRNARMFGELSAATASAAATATHPVAASPKMTKEEELTAHSQKRNQDSVLAGSEEPSKKKLKTESKNTVLTIEKLISKDEPPGGGGCGAKAAPNTVPAGALVSRQGISCFGGNSEDLKHPLAKSRVYKNKKYRYFRALNFLQIFWSSLFTFSLFTAPAILYPRSPVRSGL